MKLRRLVPLLAFFWLMLPGSLRADTVYSYTSPTYNNCTGTYCTGGPYALSFTFDVTAGTPLDNLSLFGSGSDITADVSSFTFTDGSGLEITQANATAYSFQIATDASGNLTSWAVWADADPTSPIPLLEDVGSNNFGTDSYDYSMVGPPPDDAVQNKGYYQPVPEPSCSLLLGAGLLSILALAARYKRHPPSASR
jgi:hypothetical protein